LSNEEEIREAVDKAKAPNKFNIVDVLNNRSYPESVVNIIMDESLTHKAAMIKEQIEKIEAAKQTKLSSFEDLVAKRDEIFAELTKCSYAIHVCGISEGQREASYAEARKKYPVEYESANDITALLGNQSERKEKESPQRDALFTDYLWQKHIVKIVNPDGEEQLDFSYATIRTMRDSLPLSATMKINEAIDKLRSASALFVLETGEDFLAKP
tara:strand:- start:1 stop:639 length:639 start_codon:yes stop_codon:yes gene_type:complete